MMNAKPKRAERKAVSETSETEMIKKSAHEPEQEVPQVAEEYKPEVQDGEVTGDLEPYRVGRPENFVRKPFGSLDRKLDYPPREGYHRHWFNDNPGRIMDAKGAGYDHVLDREGNLVKRTVGTNPNGPGGLVAYLMEIPMKWYEEDQAKIQAEIDKFDTDLKRGAAGDVEPGSDGRYVPTDSTGQSRIKVGSTAGRQRSSDE